MSVAETTNTIQALPTAWDVFCAHVNPLSKPKNDLDIIRLTTKILSYLAAYFPVSGQDLPTRAIHGALATLLPYSPLIEFARDFLVVPQCVLTLLKFLDHVDQHVTKNEPTKIQKALTAKTETANGFYATYDKVLKIAKDTLGLIDNVCSSLLFLGIIFPGIGLLTTAPSFMKDMLSVSRTYEKLDEINLKISKDTNPAEKLADETRKKVLLYRLCKTVIGIAITVLAITAFYFGGGVDVLIGYALYKLITSAIQLILKLNYPAYKEISKMEEQHFRDLAENDLTKLGA